MTNMKIKATETFWLFKSAMKFNCIHLFELDGMKLCCEILKTAQKTCCWIDAGWGGSRVCICPCVCVCVLLLLTAFGCYHQLLWTAALTLARMQIIITYLVRDCSGVIFTCWITQNEFNTKLLLLASSPTNYYYCSVYTVMLHCGMFKEPLMGFRRKMHLHLALLLSWNFKLRYNNFKK